MKLKLELFAILSVATGQESGLAIPHESEIVGGDVCDGENSGAEYVATFSEDIFVHNTVIAIPEGSAAMAFADVEVLLDHPAARRPVRCGKKFSKVAARKLKSSEIIFVCKGAGKTAALGRQAADARVFIKKKVKKGTTRCLDFSGITFNTIQEDLAVWSDWSEWSECEDDTVSRTRTCTGVFCEEESETETKDEACLKCDEGFGPNEVKTECEDIDECALGMCPENSSCTNTEGSYSCVCLDGMYGDDMNFCITPRACHNGDKGAGCTCEVLEFNTTELVTWWNDTETSCTAEFFINFEDQKVNSWFAELDFDSEAEMTSIWRARTQLNNPAATHALETMYFNVEKVMEMRFHAMFAYSCDMFEEQVPTVTLCTEDEIITTTPAPTTVEHTTQPPVVIVTTEKVIQLSEDSCESLNVEAMISWLNADGETVTQIKVEVEAKDGAHEWRIELPFDASHQVVTWTATTTLDKVWTLTAKDYNPVLYHDSVFTMQVIGEIATDDDGNLLHGAFCYKTEL